MTHEKNKNGFKNSRKEPLNIISTLLRHSPAFSLPASEPKGEAVLESCSNSAATAISAAIAGPRPALISL